MNHDIANRLRRQQELRSEIERLETAYRVYGTAKGCQKAAERVWGQLVSNLAMLEQIGGIA